jgi:hypothetical protein
MKKIFLYAMLFSCFALSHCITSAQGFAGFRAGNTGVNGVFVNPANIAGSNHLVDVNLGSANVEVGLTGFSKTDSLYTKDFKGRNKQELISSTISASGYLNIDLYGPSAMLRLNKASSIALTSRYRILGNVHQMGGTFTENEKDSLYTYTGEADQKFALNAWKEIGVSFATTVAKTTDHTLRMGVSAKYLRGDMNIYAGLQNFSGTAFAGQEAYVTNTNGRFFAGSNALEDEEKCVHGKGLGMDLGFVYEKAAAPHEQAVKKYKYRLGVSIRDIGFMTYRIAGNQYLDYTAHINNGDRMPLADLEDKNMEQTKQYMNGKPQWFTLNDSGAKTYKVSLPTTALVNMDMALGAGFYVDMAAQVNLVNRNNAYSSFLPNWVSVTPRFESRCFSIYAPVTYNEYSKMNAGLSIKWGPVFIGSNSLFSNVFGGDVQDVHLGLRFGLGK